MFKHIVRSTTALVLVFVLSGVPLMALAAGYHSVEDAEIAIHNDGNSRGPCCTYGNLQTVEPRTFAGYDPYYCVKHCNVAIIRCSVCNAFYGYSHSSGGGCGNLIGNCSYNKNGNCPVC